MITLNKCLLLHTYQHKSLHKLNCACLFIDPKKKKRKLKYFFYFTHPLLQNTHISLSILHIYSIKYSFFFTFFIISFPLEQTHKLVFSVEPHPHPHPSFNKITHTQPAIVFSVELQTQHKPKITHTQPPATNHHQRSNRTNPSESPAFTESRPWIAGSWSTEKVDRFRVIGDERG